MPLTQDDEDWRQLSKDWFVIEFDDKQKAMDAHYIAWKHCGVPYGSYVVVNNELRLETAEQLAAVKAYLTKNMGYE